MTSPFRRVEARYAGPGALGILVPPGSPTPVVLRPRALPWDLLPARWNGDDRAAPALCRFPREEAARVARQLHQELEQGVIQGANPVSTVGDGAGRQFQVWLRGAELVWLLCRRAPGQAYTPALFDSQPAARTEAERLTLVVWPAPDAAQEYYFNTQNFAAHPG